MGVVKRGFHRVESRFSSEEPRLKEGVPLDSRFTRGSKRSEHRTTDRPGEDRTIGSYNSPTHVIVVDPCRLSYRFPVPE